jgi:hypothetical protein
LYPHGKYPRRPSASHHHSGLEMTVTNGFFDGECYPNLGYQWLMMVTLWKFLTVCELENDPVEIVGNYPLIAWWIFP